MTTDLSSTLKKYEKKISNNEIKSFTVSIKAKSIIISTAGSDATQEVQISDELQNMLQSFFYGIKIIEYGSFDYTTLIGLINAQSCLEQNH